MPVFETFSKRQAKAAGKGTADVYQYDQLPRPFRVQVAHIWTTAIGAFFEWHRSYETEPPPNEAWRWIHDTLARERGEFTLVDKDWHSAAKCAEFLLTADTASALDIIELSFRFIDKTYRHTNWHDRERYKITQEPDDAIDELNYRFREHGIGYQYLDGKLLRVDSQYVHAEVVTPALSLLNEEGFTGPSEEFLKAHEHLRHGRHKEAISEALKALESTMKSVCHARKWVYPENATAKPLIDILFKNGLLPKEMESHFAALRNTLEAGLPTVRNRASGHGQGREPVSVPQYLAAYALHLAATNIVFMVQAHRAKK